MDANGTAQTAGLVLRLDGLGCWTWDAIRLQLCVELVIGNGRLLLTVLPPAGFDEDRIPRKRASNSSCFLGSNVWKLSTRGPAKPNQSSTQNLKSKKKNNNKTIFFFSYLIKNKRKKNKREDWEKAKTVTTEQHDCERTQQISWLGN